MNAFCFNPFHCSRSFMFRSIVLREAGSQVFNSSHRFSSKIALHLAPSTFPSTLTMFPATAQEKHLKAQCCCYHHVSQWGWCQTWWCSDVQRFIFCHTLPFAFWPKKSHFGLIRPQHPLPHARRVPHVTSGICSCGFLLTLWCNWLFSYHCSIKASWV